MKDDYNYLPSYIGRLCILWKWEWKDKGQGLRWQNWCTVNPTWKCQGRFKSFRSIKVKMSYQNSKSRWPVCYLKSVFPTCVGHAPIWSAAPWTELFIVTTLPLCQTVWKTFVIRIWNHILDKWILSHSQYLWLHLTNISSGLSINHCVTEQFYCLGKSYKNKKVIIFIPLPLIFFNLVALKILQSIQPQPKVNSTNHWFGVSNFTVNNFESIAV